jgi:hypothetical protein
VITDDDLIRPLCPQLYKRLRELFDYVEVANPGEGMVARQRRHMGATGVELRFDVVDPGEYYRVNCPFCSDTRQRLWLNHMYGQPDPSNDRRTLGWLGVCYNDGCLESWARRQQLEDMCFGHLNRDQRQIKFRVSPGVTESAALREVTMPGVVMRLDELGDSHPARRYIIDQRGFDPDVLARDYGLAYCTEADPNYPAAEGRLIIPVHMHGQLVGWQGRVPDDNIDWKRSGIAKYYGMRGMPKRLMLYNYDNARQHTFCIVTEGVTDVWAIGDPAVALLGKKIHPMQRRLLTEFENGVIMMLDPDFPEATATAVESLSGPLDGRVGVVTLPQDMDPAMFDETVLWGMIKEAADTAGVDISDAWEA